MNTIDIESKWEEFRDQKGYLQRLDPIHPLDFFIGITEEGKDELVLLTETEPVQMKSGRFLEIEKKLRKDGKWATQIVSLQRENQNIFAKLCLDLVESSKYAKNEEDGMNNVIMRFFTWQRMFATMKDGLPKSVIKGLVGELLFLSNTLSKKYSWDTAVNAWQGPEGSDRDFVFEDTWYEVKSITSGKDIVTISSLEQLNTYNTGYLTVLNVDISSQTDAMAFNINTIINNIRESLIEYPYQLQLFEYKLVKVGYISNKKYDAMFFTCSKPTYFRVDNTFPKLIAQKVSKEIVGVRYDLSLAAIQNWKVVDNIWNCRIIEKIT